MAQCTKVRWWQHGDNNTRYFYALLSKKKQAKVIKMNLDNGTALSSPQEIHKGAIEYF